MSVEKVKQSPVSNTISAVEPVKAPRTTVFSAVRERIKPKRADAVVTATAQTALQKEAPRTTVIDALRNIVVPIVGAGVAVVPAFPDLIAKSALQQGKPVPRIGLLACFKEGVKASPTVGVLVGGQMIVQPVIEKVLAIIASRLSDQEDKPQPPSLLRTVAASGIVGLLSVPPIAVFNAQTMREKGETTLMVAQKALRNLQPRQAVAITLQECSFVAAISIGDPLAAAMKEKWGDNKVVEYTAAATSGALAGTIGHGANTAYTRWQKNLQVTHVRQLFWGMGRRVRGLTIFGVGYKLTKDVSNAALKKSE
jgi:hypothetical protein